MVDFTGMKKSCMSAARADEAAASDKQSAIGARVWRRFKDNGGTAAAITIAFVSASFACSSTDIRGSQGNENSYSCDPDRCEAPGDRFSGDLKVGSSVPVGQFMVSLKSVSDKGQTKCGTVGILDFCGKQVAEIDISDGENKPVPNATEMSIALSGVDMAQDKAHLDIISTCSRTR